MKDKILCWLDNEWIHFGIAKFIQDKYDCDMYAAIDIRYTSRKFYESQNIIKFNKTWYYRDHISTTKPYDLNYLKSFEEKYNINLWNIAFAERFFYKYNEFYKFTDDEILSLLETECKFFEEVLEKTRPDYLLIKMTDSHQSNLLHQLCKKKGIKTLMISLTRFGYRYGVFDDYDQIMDSSTDGDIESSGNRTISELQNFLQDHSARKEITIIESRSQIPILRRIKKYLKYVKLIGDEDFKTYYANYGKSRLKVVGKFLFLRRIYRKRFIDKKFIKEIDKEEKFIYFPLHYEPERALLLEAPFYTDQILVISNIARSLPIEYKLYVKEHVAMFETGWRKISYYEKILEIPNVRLIHPSVKSEELLKKTSLVVTISGTSGLEAVFYNKPAIVLADVSYASISSVYRLKNIEELPMVIRKMLHTKVNVSDLNKYVNQIMKKSFEFDFHGLYLDFNEYFVDDFANGFGSIPVQKMESFLEKYNEQFEKLAMEHIKQIMTSKHDGHSI